MSYFAGAQNDTEWPFKLWYHRYINLALTCLPFIVYFPIWLLLSHRHIFQEECSHQCRDTEYENCHESMLKSHSQRQPEQLEHLAEQVQYLLRSLRSY